MRRKPLSFWVAWIICCAVVVLAVVQTAVLISGSRAEGEEIGRLADVVFVLVPVVFAIPAALLIARQPRNIIGWLVMTPPLVGIANAVLNLYLIPYHSQPPPLPFPLLFTLMFIINGGWIGLIFPLLLIPLFFPTGRLLSPRWRWVVSIAGAMMLFFLFWSLFAREVVMEGVAWKYENPAGFITDAIAERYFYAPWTLLLGILTAASLASIVVRYRRAGLIEREQIKWLLYACALFAAVYIPSLIINFDLLTGLFGDIYNVLFFIAIAAIPAAIAISILRYRLFDIDVVIRLTLVYALVTGLLGLAYLGGVVLLQTALRSLTGQASSLAVVITTLMIAALFNPLRAGIQGWIDRRFYRKKYNAEQALAAFTAAARSGSDLDTLTEMLEEVVQTNLQPSHVRLVLRPQNLRPQWRGKEE